MRFPAKLAAICAMFAGCSPSGTSRLELEDLNLDYAFLVIFDEEGTPTRLTEPFGIDGETISFGQLPTITFVNDEDQFVLVGLTKEAIAKSVGGFELARARELTATLTEPPQVARAIEKESGIVLMSPLPKTAKLFSGELTNGGRVALAEDEQYRDKIERSLTLNFPVDPEYCRVPEQTPLGPLTDEIVAFETVLPRKANVVEVFWLGTERLLTVTWTAVAVLEPGKPLRQGPSAMELSPDSPTAGEGLKVIRAAVDPRTRTSTTAVRALIGGIKPDAAFSRIWELEIRGTEIVVVSVTDHMNFPLGDVTILYDGRQFVSSLFGQIYERDPNTGALALAHTLLTHFQNEDEPVFLAAVDDQKHPLIASTQGRVHIYDATDHRFTYHELYQEGIAALDALEFQMLTTDHTEDGELEIWVGAERGTLYRRIGSGDWNRVKPIFPPRFSACITENEDDGSLFYNGHWWDAAITKDYVHVVPRDCAALLQFRRSDACVSVLPLGDRPVETTDDFINAIDALEGQLAAGGDFGRVYFSAW